MNSGVNGNRNVKGLLCSNMSEWKNTFTSNGEGMGEDVRERQVQVWERAKDHRPFVPNDQKLL